MYGLRTLITAAVVAAVAAAPAAAIPPGGAKPSHNGATVKLAKKTAAPGGKIPVTGRRFPAGKQATVKLDDETIIGVFDVDRSGRFTGKVTIPANVLKLVRPGKHWLRFLAPASKVNRQSNTSVQKYFTLTRK